MQTCSIKNLVDDAVKFDKIPFFNVMMKLEHRHILFQNDLNAYTIALCFEKVLTPECCQKM